MYNLKLEPIKPFPGLLLFSLVPATRLFSHSLTDTRLSLPARLATLLARVLFHPSTPGFTLQATHSSGCAHALLRSSGDQVCPLLTMQLRLYPHLLM